MKKCAKTCWGVLCPLRCHTLLPNDAVPEEALGFACGRVCSENLLEASLGYFQFFPGGMVVHPQVQFGTIQ